MSLELIVVSHRLEPISRAEVTALELRLGVAMPPGFAELVTGYGEGTICNELDVWGPTRILNSLDEAREQWAEYWFWEHPDLVQADFAAAVQVGGTANGDQIVLVPGRGLVVLPRHRDDAIDIGTSYDDAVRWFCTSGHLIAARSLLWFESWVQQSCYENWGGGEYRQVRDAIAALDMHVAVDESFEPVCTFLIPGMGGHVYILGTRGALGLYVHIRFEPEYSAQYARIEKALVSVGVTKATRWGAEPAD
ncbi:hypothetical protein [Nocardia concava]|uniref:hypothetical protein n=1 Tax=Nocardia concava TaxID=257281 RepID=UPI0002F01DD2|nr:hypothetical protein [Nocardia concava]